MGLAVADDDLGFDPAAAERERGLDGQSRWIEPIRRDLKCIGQGSGVERQGDVISGDRSLEKQAAQKVCLITAEAPRDIRYLANLRGDMCKIRIDAD